MLWNVSRLKGHEGTIPGASVVTPVDEAVVADPWYEGVGEVLEEEGIDCWFLRRRGFVGRSWMEVELLEEDFARSDDGSPCLTDSLDEEEISLRQLLKDAVEDRGFVETSKCSLCCCRGLKRHVC